ncbi:MAG: PQQ-binding-like beta-propeller repeat protein [Candidatus Stahlbacteria bacterium]|nr:PQQ-binding-like beta-propeller repeat protein [Candidatus Stahlbacteria bacterium]
MKGRILLLSVFIPVLVQADVWPFYRHDVQRTGISPYKGPDCCNIVCTADIRQSMASPVIDGSGHLYIQGQESMGNWYLWCVNTSDCSINWKYPLGAAGPSLYFHSSCGISSTDGTIYVGYKQVLYAINPNGTLKWSYKVSNDGEDEIISSPAVVSDGTIYVGCKDGYLYAVNPDSTLKWRYLTGELVSSPAIGSDGTIYIGCNGNYKLYAINPDGSFKWAYNTSGYIRSSPAVGSDGTIYIGSGDNCLYAIYPDGTLKWMYNTGDDVNSSPAIDDIRGVVYVGSDASKVYAIYTTGGGLKWQTSINDEIGYSSPAIAYPNNMLYIGDNNDEFYAINAETGNIICSNLHTWEITSPTIDDPANNGGNQCVWYYEFCNKLYKVCCPPTGTEENSSCIRDRISLLIHPNPFIAATTILFTLPVEAPILLEVYDVTGRLVERLTKRNYAAGEYTVKWSAEGVRKGIYFCKLTLGNRKIIQKLILLK